MERNHWTDFIFFSTKLHCVQYGKYMKFCLDILLYIDRCVLFEVNLRVRGRFELISFTLALNLYNETINIYK